MKHLTIFLLLIIFLSFSVSSVLASGFALKNIGALNVDGSNYKHYWYTSGNVNFQGIAPAGTQVTASVDGVSGTATADSSGNWSYPTTLTEADHKVNFSANGSTISFTLTITKVIPANVKGIPEPETPTVGIITPTVFFFLSGVLAFLSSFLLQKKALAKRIKATK